MIVSNRFLRAIALNKCRYSPLEIFLVIVMHFQEHCMVYRNSKKLIFYYLVLQVPYTQNVVEDHYSKHLCPNGTYSIRTEVQ